MKFAFHENFFFNKNKFQVAAAGITWFDFSSRYRGVIERIQKIRQSEYRQFIFNLNQTRDFLIIEKSFFSKFSFLLIFVFCLFI